MPETLEPRDLPQATIERRKRLRVSVVWIIPILAAVIAIGIAVQRLMNEGPTVTIVFKGAEGVEAGKTIVKYKDVKVGQVTGVQLSKDYKQVVVTVQMEKFAAGLLVEDTSFWVVAPRVTLSGVSGLGTLLSGNYIGLQPGTSSARRREYTGLDVAPAVTGQPGREFVLEAASLGSVGVGSPVYYRSLNVGEVVAYALARDGRSIEMKVFVNAPYDVYVTASTRFWNASGIDISAGAEGVHVQTESLVSLLAGGLAFDTPDYLPAGTPAAAGARFELYASKTLAMKQPESAERRFVLYFDQSVRGLSVGAPVTLLGLQVGQVTEVGLSLTPNTRIIRPRAVITFYPERLLEKVSQQERAAMRGIMGAGENPNMVTLKHLIEEQGLRAQLRTGNLLTGDLYVAFEYFHNVPKVKVDWSASPLVLPVAPGGLASLQAKLDSLLAKIDRLPLDAMGSQVKDLLVNLNATLKDVDTMVGEVNTKMLPASEQTLKELNRVIANGDQALFGKESAGPQDLRDALQEMARTARAVRVLVDYLERHPEALIRGKKEAAQ